MGTYGIICVSRKEVKIMTKKEFFENVIATCADVEMVEFAQKELDRLEKRADTSKRAREQKSMNVLHERQNAILEVLDNAEGKKFTTGQIAEQLETSTSALVKALKTLTEKGEVKMEIVKKTKYYSI